MCLLDACAHGKNTGLHILLVCVFVSHLRGRQWELPCCLLRQYLYFCTSTASKSSTCCFSPTLLHDLVVECAHSSKKVDEEQSKEDAGKRGSQRELRGVHIRARKSSRLTRRRSGSRREGIRENGSDAKSAKRRKKRRTRRKFADC